LAYQDKNLQVLPRKITVDFETWPATSSRAAVSKDPELLLSLFTVNLEEGTEAGATDNISG